MIRNVRPLGRKAVDVVLGDGGISALLPASRAAPEIATLIDGQGQRQLVAFPRHGLLIAPGTHALMSAR